jgi:hypothetical protein
MVYQARVWDHQNGTHIITPHKWTKEGIDRIETGQLLPETAEDVSESFIDGQGRYSLPKQGATDA